jgi:hypothetical protein
MTQVTRTPATFVVPPGTPDIPAGEHPGYVEHVTVQLHGHPHTSRGRCMLHLERDEYPDWFSQENSMTSIDINVEAGVSKGEISYR